MKIIKFVLIISLGYFSCTVKNKNNCILDVIWKIEKNSINTIHTEGEIFYKIVILRQLDVESKYEGEHVDQIYILIGQYGEIPDGRLLDLGIFYNVISTEIDTYKNLIFIKYGAINSPTIDTINISNMIE